MHPFLGSDGGHLIFVDAGLVEFDVPAGGGWSTTSGLLGMVDGDPPSPEQVGELACGLVHAPRDCTPDAWPWCFGADKLADVSGRLCANPHQPIPDEVDRREGDWVRTWNGSSRQRYGPVTPPPP